MPTDMPGPLRRRCWPQVLVLFKLRKAALRHAASSQAAGGDALADGGGAAESLARFDAADQAGGDDDMDSLAVCLHIQETASKVISCCLSIGAPAA